MDKEKKVTLTELQQVKKDIDNNVIVSKSTWLRILDFAIANAPAEFQPWTQEQEDELRKQIAEGLGIPERSGFTFITGDIPSFKGSIKVAGK